MAGQEILARIAILHDAQSSAIEPKLRARGYRWATFQLLTTLYGHARGLVQAEVARRLAITPPTLTEAIQLHLRLGLIEQVDDRRDRRSKRVLLTPAGKAAVKLMVRDIGAIEEQMLKGITETELSVVARVLDQMLTNLEGGDA
ncbi:MAG: winged helix DNA-binding protein [Chthonomonas sp.]|nr:winged helix DNA-binding protein [Chthonomonas sp.]